VSPAPPTSQARLPHRRGRAPKIQGGSYGYSYPLHRSVPAVEPPPVPQPEPAVVFATARLTGHGTLAATGVRTIVGQADLAAVTFARAAGIRATSGAATLAASTSGSVAGTRTVYTAAALAATVTVELSGYATMAAAARLHASTTGDAWGHAPSTAAHGSTAPTAPRPRAATSGSGSSAWSRN
jgi:hypothetical protein